MYLKSRLFKVCF